MATKPQITILGTGRLGSALAVELKRAGYHVREVIPGRSVASWRRARELAKLIDARAVSRNEASFQSGVIWFCVPDRAIAAAARELAPLVRWKGKIAFHSSGALSSDELDVLRRRGAAVASVHPFMTFVRGSVPSLRGVSFGVEGDASAVRVARAVVRRLGGEGFHVAKNRKAMYHTWGAFTSPLLVALLATAEQVAQAAGLSRTRARKNMLPIVRQTLANFAKLGPAGASSGPIVRGDADIVREHLQVLGQVAGARDVYVALSLAALRLLPAENRRALERVLRG
jgi:predicted short-subunit dehydrogenase-like oxidoreductase (DUF2520 family)